MCTHVNQNAAKSCCEITSQVQARAFSRPIDFPSFKRQMLPRSTTVKITEAYTVVRVSDSLQEGSIFQLILLFVYQLFLAFIQVYIRR